MKKLSNSILKPLLSLSICFYLVTSTFTSCNHEQSFTEYTDALFLEEVTANTLNLHYTIEDPAAYGIKNYEISLGDFSKEARQQSKEYLHEQKETLAEFPYFDLTTEEQLTFDILWDYLSTQEALAEYDLYQEPLSYSGGLQMELPILFAEYEFRNEQDVKDYLELIALTDEYFAQVMDFEKEKSEAGLFMSDTLCQAVIESCYAFLENTESHYLITTFETRLEKLGLTDKKIAAYTVKNKKILKEQLFPAYEDMIKELRALQGTGVNDGGLCHFVKGKDYYELLVNCDTGCEDSIDEIFRRIELQRINDLLVCASLQEEDETLATRCSTLEWEMENPVSALKELQQDILTDFPTPPTTTYEINYVDQALEDYLAPAFYIVAPLDNYEENVIYINEGQVTNDLYAFTTLAHEGYPGHLYQTVMSYTYQMPAIRSILNYSGYVEGWATYIEMLSYSYADIDEDVAAFLSHNQSATLSLYASSDIGLHYYGWSTEDMYEFWGGFGITNTSIIDEITQLILSEPGNYLKYYIGYIEFLELRDYAESTLGNSFHLKDFHRSVLDIGPAPFAIIEKYLEEYYSCDTASDSSSVSDAKSSHTSSNTD